MVGHLAAIAGVHAHPQVQHALHMLYEASEGRIKETMQDNELLPFTVEGANRD